MEILVASFVIGCILCVILVVAWIAALALEYLTKDSQEAAYYRGWDYAASMLTSGIETEETLLQRTYRSGDTSGFDRGIHDYINGQRNEFTGAGS